MIKNLSNIAAILAFISIFMSSCTDGKSKTRIHKTTHFEFYYSALDEDNIEEIGDSLESFYQMPIDRLKAENVKTIQVYLYENGMELNAAHPDIPEWALGLATSATEIHMVSPNNEQYPFKWMISNLQHEFVHCISMNLNPSIANSPRWLWESVAIYESNQQTPIESLELEGANATICLEELNSFSNTIIYKMGYSIGDFIVSTYGLESWRQLILNHGNIEKTLGLTEQEFCSAWKEHAFNKIEDLSTH